jgi:hypothetical protein
MPSQALSCRLTEGTNQIQLRACRAGDDPDDQAGRAQR